MVGAGPCRNYIYVCPACGRVTGGATAGGLLRDCRVCPFRGMCSYRELEHLEQIEHVCSSDCYLWLIFGAARHTVER
jgi:hypothetical protein